jgi:hypothetical protein
MKAEVKMRNADMESQKSHKSFFSQRNQKPAASTRNPAGNLQPLVAATKPPKFVTNQFKLMMFANGGLTSQQVEQRKEEERVEEARRQLEELKEDPEYKRRKEQERVIAQLAQVEKQLANLTK